MSQLPNFQNYHISATSTLTRAKEPHLSDMQLPYHVPRVPCAQAVEKKATCGINGTNISFNVSVGPFSLCLSNRLQLVLPTVLSDS